MSNQQIPDDYSRAEFERDQKGETGDRLADQQTPETALPPESAIAIAMGQAGCSPCQSKRGAVVFSIGRGIDLVTIVGRGHNRQPEFGACNGSDACKSTCRRTAVHAEQFALLRAGIHSRGADLLHVKSVDGRLVPSGPPSCAQCSKLALAADIDGVWLFHVDGWLRYAMTEFHRLSLLNDPAAGADQERARLQACPQCAEKELQLRKALGPGSLSAWGELLTLVLCNAQDAADVDAYAASAERAETDCQAKDAEIARLRALLNDAVGNDPMREPQ